MEPTTPLHDLHPLLGACRGVTLFALDAEGAVVAWQGGAERMTGRSADEVVGLGFAELWTRDDREAGQAQLAEAASAGGAVRDGWWRAQDGGRVRVRVTLDAVAEEAGGVAGFAGSAVDLTDEHVREQALRVSEAVFSGISSIAADAIISIDATQRITFFNQGAERIFGYRGDEVLGQPLEILIPEYARGDHHAQVESFGRSPVPSRRMGERGSIYGRRKSGEVFPAEASISRLDVGGRRVYTAVLRDATERVETERRLARQAEELARSNAELEQFAYVASHDLQEPLRMVASYTQLLARRYGERLDADAHEFIGYAVDGVTRMQALINDLLAFSRVGTRGASFEPTELDGVLARALRSLGPAVEETGAVVTAEPLPALPVDAGQIGQLFLNLIGNAIKFRGAEAPRVHVSALAGDGEWVVSVRDNGIGIDPEYADRIFLLFQRLHGRGEYPGTGIGLAICKKIVERHGGRIWVESREGEGSTFRFTLSTHPEE